MAVPAIPIYETLEKAGLKGQPLSDATAAVADGDATLRDVLRVIPAVTGIKPESTPIPHTSIVLQELVAAGLKGQQLEDAADIVLNGYISLDLMLEDIPSIIGNHPRKAIVSERQYADLFEQFGFDKASIIGYSSLIRGGKADLIDLLAPISSAEIENLSETGAIDLTDSECFGIIDELIELGFNQQQIVDSLKQIRTKHANFHDIKLAHAKEVEAKASEPAEAIAAVEQVFALQVE